MTYFAQKCCRKCCRKCCHKCCMLSVQLNQTSNGGHICHVCTRTSLLSCVHTKTIDETDSRKRAGIKTFPGREGEWERGRKKNLASLPLDSPKLTFHTWDHWTTFWKGPFFLLHQILCFDHTGMIAMFATSDQVIYHFFNIIK